MVIAMMLEDGRKSEEGQKIQRRRGGMLKERGRIVERNEGREGALLRGREWTLSVFR